MKHKILFNLIYFVMIFGFTSKSYAYDYVVFGAEAVAAVSAVTLSAGAIYQYWSTKKNEQDYPAPGKMVDIGGYRLHINCTGSSEAGKPTIVLDAALGGFSLDWVQVQSKVAKFARVCSYDRGGYGWSDESPNPRTSKYIAQELHQLLDNAGEQGPFILVGHSIGAINVRVFATMYPKKVAGVVLVDASHEDQKSKLPEPPTPDLMKRLTKSVLDNPNIATFLTAVGVTRVMQPGEKAYRAKISTVKFVRALSLETINIETSRTQVKNSVLENTPLTVITAGKSGFEEGMGKDWAEFCDKNYQSWLELQKDLLAKSTNSQQVFATKSGHMIPQDQPDIIVDAIREMLELEVNLD